MSETRPQFSIATPVFNGMPVIRQCVGSVRGQAGDVQAEHIIQVGGSTDGTAEWLSGQPDLKVFVEADSGMYDAINKGWSRATGDILCWLNADEQLLPDTLESVRRVFSAHPDVDIVHGDAIMTTLDGEPLAARKEIPLRLAYVVNGFLYALSCGLFFRRRLWDEGILRIDDRFRNAGDCDLVIRLMRAGKKVYHIPTFVSLFGVAGDNLTVTNIKNMEREVRGIQKTYGAAPHAWQRKGVLLGRYVERLLRGCYGPHDIEYYFAENEQPTYRRVTAKKVSGRFTFERAEQMLKADAP